MKIGIISDSHDDVENTKKSIQIFNEKNVKYVFHAGDYIYPGIISLFENLDKGIKFYGVRGNNDGEIVGLIQQFNKLDNATFLNEFGKIDIENKEIGIYHGTNSSLADSLAKSQLFDLLILGHSHIKRKEIIGRTLVVNPGSANKQLSHSTKTSEKSDTPSILIMYLKNDIIDAEFINL